MRVDELSPRARVLFNAKRFAIAAYLYGRGSCTLGELRRATGLSWGDLDSNVRYLVRSGIVWSRRGLSREGPRTFVGLTREGEEAFLELSRFLKRNIEKI